MTLLAVAAGCAIAWWALRSPTPVEQHTSDSVSRVEAPRVAAASVVTPAPHPAQTAAADSEAAREEELETMAAMFAAEPALIDALEDATGAADPAVREEAEAFLDTMQLPAPNPEIAAE